MKKTIAILAAICLIINISACSKNTKNQQEAIDAVFSIHDSNGQIYLSLGMTQSDIESKIGLGEASNTQNNLNYVKYDNAQFRIIYKEGKAVYVSTTSTQYTDAMGLRVGGGLPSIADHHATAKKSEYEESYYIAFDRQLNPIADAVELTQDTLKAYKGGSDAKDFAKYYEWIKFSKSYANITEITIASPADML